MYKKLKKYYAYYKNTLPLWSSAQQLKAMPVLAPTPTLINPEVKADSF